MSTEASAVGRLSDRVAETFRQLPASIEHSIVRSLQIGASGNAGGDFVSPDAHHIDFAKLGYVAEQDVFGNSLSGREQISEPVKHHHQKTTHCSGSDVGENPQDTGASDRPQGGQTPDTGTGRTPPGSDTGSPGQTQGTDLSSIFVRGPGVTDAQYQHALAIANALPEDMKQTLLANGAHMEIDVGFAGGAQGQNIGTSGQFFADSGMADQAEVHELYEMYGRLSNGGPGSWSDPQAVQLADRGMMSGRAQREGDLNDTIAGVPGDGDHMANAFVADFFATHPELYQDTAGRNTLTTVVRDDPALVQYIAQSQDLTFA